MAAAALQPYALPVVARVNLMPRAETERRETATLLRRWVGGLVFALVIVAITCGAAAWMQFSADQRLASENARTNALLNDLGGLADVRATLDLQSELTTFRTEAMATDLEWAGILRTVDSALPEGVTVTGFQLAPGGMPVGEDPAAEIGAVGTVFLSSKEPRGIVPLASSLRQVEGVLLAEAWNVTPTEDHFTYEIRVAFDQSVYTGAYNEEEDE